MFKLHNYSDGQFYFTVHAKNHKILLTSEIYRRKENAVKGINALCSALGIKKASCIDFTTSKR